MWQVRVTGRYQEACDTDIGAGGRRAHLRAANRMRHRQPHAPPGMHLRHAVSLPAEVLEAPLVRPAAELLRRSLVPLIVEACVHACSVSITGPWMSVLEVMMLVLIH
jgi:hypothetical protein